MVEGLKKDDAVHVLGKIFVRLASHGREQVKPGEPWDEVYTDGWFVYCGPSKAAGCSVVRHGDKFIRVFDASIE